MGVQIDADKLLEFINQLELHLTIGMDGIMLPAVCKGGQYACNLMREYIDVCLDDMESDGR